jgi:uncharacterized protein (TIGR00255 family)
MIKSMTGFGLGELNTEIGRFTVEVKSVNNRACSLVVKLPETLTSLESQLSSYIKSRISRGQINVSVGFSKDEGSDGKRVILDRELAREYCEKLAEVKECLSLTDPVSLNTIAALPGVINVEESMEDIDQTWAALRGALVIAVDQLIETREAEGAAMLEDLLRRLETMSQLTERINARAPEVVEEYRQRLRRRIRDLLQEEIAVDESRIAMEVAIMADRCDITEEVIRLRSHTSQIRDSLKDPEGAVGRHLDFILQEVNREVNTIASKANDAQISADCIRFKDETEKMREQVRNIE